MKKIHFGLAIFALALGVTLSSFTTRTTLNERVWFDETASYQFAVYGNQQAILDYFNMSSPGSTTRVAVGYNESRYGAAPNVDPFVSITGSGASITDAELKLSSGQLTGASATIDEQLFQ